MAPHDNSTDSSSTNPTPKAVSGGQHGDGREPALLEHLLSRRQELQGNSDAVLNAIDVFGEEQYLMNVGRFKGEEIERILGKLKPARVLEIGTYVGYSSLLFGRHVKDGYPDAATPDEWKSAGTRQKAGYICLEFSQEYANIARQIVDLGGIGPYVKILVGSANDNIQTLRETLGLEANEKFDLVFLDHHKPLYTPDVQALESLGLIGPGTTIIADNVINPGNPAYLKYIRGSVKERKEWFATKGGEWEGKGVPEFKYESRIYMSRDPYLDLEDGVEISECVGREE